IVERVQVALPDPVEVPLLDVLVEHASPGIECIVVSSVRIELRPYRDHYACVEFMHPLDHSTRIGEVLIVEIVASPGVFRPVEPVQDDVVDRYPALAILFEDAYQFLLRGIALAALPESERPLRQQGRLAGQPAIAADDFVHTGARDKVVVDRLAALGGNRQSFMLRGWRRWIVQQPEVPALRGPLDAKRIGLAGFEFDAGSVIPGIPVDSPAVQQLLTV